MNNLLTSLDEFVLATLFGVALLFPAASAMIRSKKLLLWCGSAVSGFFVMAALHMWFHLDSEMLNQYHFNIKWIPALNLNISMIIDSSNIIPFTVLNIAFALLAAKQLQQNQMEHQKYFCIAGLWQLLFMGLLCSENLVFLGLILTLISLLLWLTTNLFDFTQPKESFATGFLAIASWIFLSGVLRKPVQPNLVLLGLGCFAAIWPLHRAHLGVLETNDKNPLKLWLYFLPLLALFCATKLTPLFSDFFLSQRLEIAALLTIGVFICALLSLMPNNRSRRLHYLIYASYCHLGTCLLNIVAANIDSAQTLPITASLIANAMLCCTLLYLSLGDSPKSKWQLAALFIGVGGLLGLPGTGSFPATFFSQTFSFQAAPVFGLIQFCAWSSLGLSFAKFAFDNIAQERTDSVDSNLSTSNSLTLIVCLVLIISAGMAPNILLPLAKKDSFRETSATSHPTQSNLQDDQEELHAKFND